MPTLYIMSGLPFSGKTTLAKKITEKTGAKMIAFDWIWAEKKGEITPDLDRVGEWRFILDEAHKRIKESLAIGNSVVYDDISARKEHREVLRTIAEQSKASFVIVYLNTPISKIKDREARNKISQERHIVASINFDKALKQWQDPAGEIGVIEYRPEDDLSEWLKKLKTITSS